ncbi:MAG TPA: hypothetical protein VK031_07415, partial [Tissierellaceae bacterium]|nr:hypothetical protein [Tissierellaceae bacterium]
MGNKKELLNYIKTVGKDRTWRQLANKFGYTSEDTVRKIVKRNLSHYTETTTVTNISSDSTTSEESNETSYDFNKGEMKISHIWDHPPTPEEIIEHHNIDESKWKLSNVWVKMKKGGYQTSALFSQKKSKDVTPDDIKRVLDNFTPPKLSLDSGSKINKKYSSPCSAFIDITDFHLDKKTLDGDTIEDRVESYQKIV